MKVIENEFDNLVVLINNYQSDYIKKCLYRNHDLLILQIGINFFKPNLLNMQNFFNFLKYVIDIKFDKSKNDFNISNWYSNNNIAVKESNIDTDIVIEINFKHFYTDFKIIYNNEYYKNIIQNLLKIISDIVEYQNKIIK